MSATDGPSERRRVRHAWLLAGAHGHHWASPATPEALAFGRAILALSAAQEAGDDAAIQAAGQAHDAAMHAFYDLQQIDAVGPLPPQTEEEARALSALPSGPVGGVAFDLAHVTGTGRLQWIVDAAGRVQVYVYRPDGRTCLSLDITGDLRRVSGDVGPAPCRCRHVDAANVCLAALGLPLLLPGAAILADQAGRTPAWWDAVELDSELIPPVVARSSW